MNVYVVYFRERWGRCLFFMGWLLLPDKAGGQVDTLRTVTVSDVCLEGNYRTREYIVFRELALQRGDTIPLHQLAGLLEIDRRKVVNTNLFISVEAQPEFSEDSATVQINLLLKERWYFLGVPVFQLADRNFNEWWYDRNRDFRRITYGGYLSYGNVTGRGDRLRALVELGFIPKYELSYSIPYIDRKMRLGLIGGVSYSTNKSLPFQTWNDKLDFLNSEAITRRRFYTFLAGTYRSRFYGYHSLDLRWNSATVADTVLRLNPRYLSEGNTQQFFQLTYSYSYDKRDIGQYPLRGHLFTIQASKRGLLPGDDVNQGYLYGVFKQYVPLSEKWYFNTTLRLRTAFPAKHPYVNMVGLGYRLDLVRGYELYVIDGQHYGLSQNELKYKLFDIKKTFQWLPRQFGTIPLAVYINSFGDLGYIRNPYPEWSNSKLSNRLLAGTGVGLDLVTFYNMVYRLNYTFNSEGEQRLFFVVAREF